MSGKNLRRRTKISRPMPQEPLTRSSFGRALFSMLQKDLPPDEYENFVKRWNSRRETSTTDSPPSSAD